jgi:predicted AAA+ superfamily ATPase
MIENIKKVESYNFWNKTAFLGINRKEYVQKLIDYQNSKLIKVLVGQRRVGKSYILRQYITHLINQGVNPENTIYINKEYTDFDFLEKYQDLDVFIKTYIEVKKITGKIHLFIDEVQRIENWEKLINSLSQDYTKEIEIIITGSNSNLLSGELSTLLSGRYVQFLVLPLSFEEYVLFNQMETTRTNYITYLQSGGLPELVHLPIEETKKHYLGALRDTILLRDIVQRYQIKDTMLLSDVFTYLTNNISNLFSINNLINYFKSKNRKTNYETLSNYIHYILQTYVVYKCERYDIKGKEIIAGNAKYYLNDLSFKNLLYPGFTHGYGYLLENLVYLELLRNGFTPYVGTLKNKEIDFIALKNGKQLYIQVAFSMTEKDTIDREYASLLDIKDNYEKWIVSMDEIPLANREGIKNIQAWELHEKLKNLEL